MIIGHKQLIDTLMKHSVWEPDDAAPNQAFGIIFRTGEKRQISEQYEYETIDEWLIYIGLSKEGKVIRLEIG